MLTTIRHPSFDKQDRADYTLDVVKHFLNIYSFVPYKAYMELTYSTPVTYTIVVEIDLESIHMEQHDMLDLIRMAEASYVVAQRLLWQEK
jgi:hypothetical protein